MKVTSTIFRTGAVLLAIGVGVVVAWRLTTPRWSEQDRRQIEARASTIIAAIEQYMSTHSSAPPSLEALVPSYLNSIPAPPMTGSQWAYWSISGSGETFGRTCYFIGLSTPDRLLSFGPSVGSHLYRYANCQGGWAAVYERF